MTKKVIAIVMALVVSMLATFGGVIGAYAQQNQAPVVTREASADASDGGLFETGLFGFKYDKTYKLFYSANNAWQRNFGYNKYYDIFARLFFMFYDTVRIRFNYDNRDWMIQLWKGQYGLVLMGSEVGVYWKEQDSDSIQYHCADDSDRIKMGYSIYSYDKLLYTLTERESWWLTGFVGGKIDKFSDRSQLSMKLSIELKDAEMTKAFVEALQDPVCGFRVGDGQDDETFLVIGNRVYLTWRENRDVQTRDF